MSDEARKARIRQFGSSQNHRFLEKREKDKRSENIEAS